MRRKEDFFRDFKKLDNAHFERFCKRLKKLKRKEVKIMLTVKSNKRKSGCIYIGATFIGCKTIGAYVGTIQKIRI